MSLLSRWNFQVLAFDEEKSSETVSAIKTNIYRLTFTQSPIYKKLLSLWFVMSHSSHSSL